MDNDMLTLLGSLQVQYDNIQLAHWNLKAPDFIRLHEYLGENYEATGNHIDMIAEFMRKGNPKNPVPPIEVQKKASIVVPIQTNESVDRTAVIDKTRKDIIAIKDLANKMFLSSTVKNAEVNDYMAIITDDMGKRFWFLTQSR